MKKILIVWLLAIFILPVAALAAEAELEKISSPDQIKYFKVVKKENGALFGIRLAKPAATAASSSATLEKISGPWDMPLFQQIRKVGNALWGYRKDQGRHLGLIKDQKLSADLKICLKNAISAKDTALKATVEKAKTLHLAAIDERTACQLQALDAADNAAVMKGFQSCAAAFKQDIKDAAQVVKGERDALQNNYREALRVCYSVATSTVVSLPVSSGNVLLEDLSDDLAL